MSEPITTAAAQYYGFWVVVLVLAAVWGIAVLVLLITIVARIR